MKKWEIQTKMSDGSWENVCIVVEDDDKPKPMQFDTEEEAQAELTEHLKDMQQAVDSGDITDFSADDYRLACVTSVPIYEIGHTLKWKEESRPKQTMMLTYTYHNGEVWKYHVGLIVAKATEEIPTAYKSVGSLRTINGHWVVDYLTASETEVWVQMEFSQ